MARVILSNLIRSQSRHHASLGYNSLKLQTPSIRPITELYSTPYTLPTIQNRWASYYPKPQHTQDSDKDPEDTNIAYYGPVSSTLKKVKLLSLSTCCLSVSLGPVITFMTSTDTNVILKGGVAASVMFMSATTTAALHWFVSPYIHKIRWEPGSDTFEAEIMSWLATPIKKTIRFADIRVADTNRPYVTFKANDEFYYVDADQCANKALLAKLTPQKASHESAFKNL